jgi:subfamily B ATP-binding cassette protein MsbA
MADVRQIMGAKLATLPIPYHDRFRSGELLSRFERDSAHMRKVLLLLFKQVAVEPFNLGWAAVYAFVLNPRLAVVLLGLPIIVFPLFRIAKRIKKRATKRQVQRADLSHVLFQMLTGIKVVKAFGGEQRESERLDQVNRKYVETSRKITHLSALAEGMLDFLQMLGAALVFWIGGYLILSDGLTMGELTAFIVVMQRFYSGAKKLTSTANDLVDASAGVERVYEVLDAENEMPDGPGELPVRALNDGVRLEDVSFSYQDRMVLEHFTLDVPAGKVVALVGPTGAGKSTICSLVARFYDPTAGRVTYDGVDLRSVKLSSVVSNLAIVTQDAFLFNESIRDNIRYGRPGATREEIERAAADAFVHDEIMGMDGGYDKLAGERGMAVSGGQRQRITIARALLKNAPVLILDEATSALDSSTEKSIQLALERLMAGRTVIVVAHRLSTILHADRVVVLDQGRILEQGSPAELLEREDGRFKRMYELQMGGIDVLEGGAGHEEAPPRFEDVSEFGRVEDGDDG